MQGPQVATLLLIVREDNATLLSEKRNAEIGNGKVNASGGKVESGESVPQAAAREAFEELGIIVDVESLEPIGFLHCYAAGVFFQLVVVFRVTEFDGVPTATHSMHQPTWFPKDRLPFDRMHAADQFWFQMAVEGEKFAIELFYEGKGEGYLGHRFIPF